MDNQVNQEVHPAVTAVHGALHNGVDRAMQWIGERNLGMKALAVVAAGGLALSACGSEGSAEPSSTTESTVTAGNSEACPESWEVVGIDHGESNKWFRDGFKAIADAVTPEDAANAGDSWMNGTEDHPGIKDDEQLFVAGYNIFFTNTDKAGLTTEGLVDEDGCATDKMLQASLDLQLHITASKWEVAEAPTTGFNTGTDAEGNVTVAATAGVSGDRTAIKATTPEGTEIYIMARCGQPVLLGGKPAGIPEGPTDETPPEVPLKHDDGRLPGDPNVPADQDRGTPDIPGPGPAGQTPGPDGYLDHETRPTVPQQPEVTTPTTQRTTDTTSPRPTSTLPPQDGIPTVPTTAPQPNPIPGKPGA